MSGWRWWRRRFRWMSKCILHSLCFIIIIWTSMQINIISVMPASVILSMIRISVVCRKVISRRFSEVVKLPMWRILENWVKDDTSSTHVSHSPSVLSLFSLNTSPSSGCISSLTRCHQVLFTQYQIHISDTCAANYNRFIELLNLRITGVNYRCSIVM